MFQHLKNIVTHTHQPDEAILDLLTNTTIGTNGAKYQHLHTVSKIHKLVNPHYITVRRNKKAIGNMTVCERPILVQNQKVNSLYIRYFAFKTFFQSSGKQNKNKRKSIFETYLKELFNTSNLDVYKPEYNPSVYWAFIDPQNNKSWNMADRFGLETIGHFSTYAFSRFYPKKNKNVSPIKPAEKESVWQNIQEFYKDYTNVSKTHLFEDDNYFVYRENEKIVAGIQVFDIHWRIDAMPGKKGKFLVNVLPHIPFLRRIINPKNYRFLGAEGLFWESGHQSKIELLLEAVLAEKKRHSMLSWFDDSDVKLIGLFESMKSGIMQKIKSDNSIEIVAKFNDFDEVLKQKMIASKKYISGFDTT